MEGCVRVWAWGMGAQGRMGWLTGGQGVSDRRRRDGGVAVLPRWSCWDFLLQLAAAEGGGVMRERGQRMMAISFIICVLSVPACKTAAVPCPSWTCVKGLQWLGGLLP